MVDHTYTITVFAIPDPTEADYESVDLELPLDASAELAMSHVQERILSDPMEFVNVPTKLFVSVERSDGDSCHASMSITYEEED